MKKVDGYTRETFARTAKELRTKAGCNQATLAELLQRSPATIRAWEQAKRMPKSPKETIQIIEYELQQWSDRKKYNRPPRFQNVKRPNRELVEFFKNMRQTAMITTAELAERMGENEWDLVALEQGKKEPKDREAFIRKLRTHIKDEIRRDRANRSV